MNDRRNDGPGAMTGAGSARGDRLVAHEPGSIRREWPWWLALLVAVVLVWCTAYGRWSAQTWRVPLSYGNDALFAMAAAKAVATGEILPFLSKTPRSFGAPFVANWNDLPLVEEGILAVLGACAKLFGLFAGVNAAVLLAHILAAWAFYWVSRRMGAAPVFAAALALVFAMSRYAFSRSLAHVWLTYYWHVPLGLWVVWWCARRDAGTADRSGTALCFAVAIVHGMQNPYYTWMFAQLLAGVCLLHAIRGHWRGVRLPAAVFVVAGLTFLLVNADTFLSRIGGGPNESPIARNYQGLEFYALKPVELFLPVVHRVDWLHAWARETYFARTMLIGEAGSPYLGVAGIVALLWLFGTMFVAAARREEHRIPWQAWVVLWVFAYGVVGGVNGVVGFALELFRGTNRYSIVILALVLLFMSRALTRVCTGWRWPARAVLAGLIAGMALLDQVPPQMNASLPAVAAAVSADRALVAEMESKLPEDAMVFEMPVVPFPEAGQVEKMEDYEHLRPYLHADSLRFSYGSTRGRPRERWQQEAASLGASVMVPMLERYGFSAILVNRKGFADGGTKLLTDLREAGSGKVLAETADFVAVALTPAARPTWPVEFGAGWYGLEAEGARRWRWSSGNALVALHNPDDVPQRVRVSFGVASGGDRALTIRQGATVLKSVSLKAGAPVTAVELDLTLDPGRNELRFETDLPGERPPNGDPRALAYAVYDFAVMPMSESGK